MNDVGHLHVLHELRTSQNEYSCLPLNFTVLNVGPKGRRRWSMQWNLKNICSCRSRICKERSPAWLLQYCTNLTFVFLSNVLISWLFFQGPRRVPSLHNRRDFEHSTSSGITAPQLADALPSIENWSTMCIKSSLQNTAVQKTTCKNCYWYFSWCGKLYITNSFTWQLIFHHQYFLCLTLSDIPCRPDRKKPAPPFPLIAVSLDPFPLILLFNMWISNSLLTSNKTLL